MRVKRYRCRDVQEALVQIRQDLGPEAVVLGTRELPGSGGRHGRPLLEVTAAVDVGALPGSADEPEPTTPAVSPETVDEETAEERLGWLEQLLVDDGFGRALARKLVRTATAGTTLAEDMARLRERVLVEIERRLHVTDAPWLHDASVSLFFGPAGAGKSTVVAHVAAFAAFQQRQKVVIVSADGERPGASGRLEALARVMEIPVHTVRRPDELSGLVSSLHGVDRVLVDTPPLDARGQLVERWAPVVQRLVGAVYLCLPSDGALRTTLRVARTAAVLGPRAFIATRADEAAALGSVFAAQQLLACPIALVTKGPRVPDDVELAHAETLGRRILSSNPGSEPTREGKTDGRTVFVA